MAEEGKLAQDAARAVRANNLLNDELLKESLETVKAAYLQAWAGSQPQQVAERERYYQAYILVDLVKAHLYKTIADGRLAQSQLAEIAKAGGRKVVTGFRAA